MNSRTFSAGATAAAVACVLALAVPASAAATATHYRTQYLSSSAAIGSVACVTTRTIKLAKGSYDWEQEISPTPSETELGSTTLYLTEAGYYTWIDCIQVMPSDGDIYSFSTSLQSPSGTVWNLDGVAYVRPSGNYTWGSYLKPLF